MAGHRHTGTPKTGGRKAGTPNKRTVALRTATATAAEQISAALGSEVFHGNAHTLLMTVYKDLKQPIGLRMEAAKAALPYEKPRLASIENKIVDEFENMTDEELEAWLDGRAAARVKVRQRSHEPRRHRAAATDDDGAGQASLISRWSGREQTGSDRNGATIDELCDASLGRCCASPQRNRGARSFAARAT